MAPSHSYLVPDTENNGPQLQWCYIFSKGPARQFAQGAFLGIFFFVVKYNGASLRPSIPRLMLEPRCRAKFKTCRKDSCIVHAKDMHALYIDDLSEAEAIELKRQLVNDPIQRPFPLSLV